MALGDRLGFAGLLVAVIGVALVYLWPDKRWIGWLCLGIAAILAASWGTLEIREKFGSSAASFWISILVGAIFGGGAAGLIWQSVTSARALGTESDAIQLSMTCDTVNLPIAYRGEMRSLDTIFFKRADQILA
jgi:hypothetical protein